MANEKVNDFLKGAKKVTKKAADATMELADIAALNVKLQAQKVKLSEKFEILGRLSYEKLEKAADNAQQIAATVEEINKLKETVENTKAEIRAKRSAKNKKKKECEFKKACDCPLKDEE